MAEPLCSPLNGKQGVFCAWRIHRRLVSEAIEDQVWGEESVAFEVRTPAGARAEVDVDGTFLHLREGCSDAWTAEWSGLLPPMQRLLRTRLEGTLDGARYHCEHTVLEPETRVTFSAAPPAVLTDLPRTEAIAWARRVAVRRAVPGLLMLLAGLCGLVL